MLDEILTLNVFAFFLVFARFGTAFMLMPGFNASYVPVRVRLTAALAIAFVVLPLVAPSLPPPPSNPIRLVMLIGGEVLIGAFLGTLMLLLVTILQVAGTLAALVSSLANAFVQDAVAEQQSSVIAGFLITLGVVLLFVTDSHHLMLKGAVASYANLVPGMPLPAGDMSQALARTLADSFAIGVNLAAPLVIVGFAYYLGLGLLSRLMPQLPVFFVGLPIQLVVMIGVLALTTSGAMLVFLDRARDQLGAMSGG
jgi:flagellar biosynthetic protein FliR